MVRRLLIYSTALPNRLMIKTNASASYSPCETACSTRYLSHSLSLSLSLFCDGFMSFVACLEPSTIQVIDLCKWFFFFFFFKSWDLLPFWNFVSHYEIVNGVIMRIGVF